MRNYKGINLKGLTFYKEDENKRKINLSIKALFGYEVDAFAFPLKFLL